MPSSPTDESAVFPALPQELTIYTAAETRDQWLQWWHVHGTRSGPVLGVACDAVDSVDAAGLQLLIALRHLVRRHDLVLALRAPSTALVAACQAMGASALLTEQGST
jgi:anti-anti-sigma regulatory factor